MTFTIGLDIGSTYTKGVVMDDEQNILAHTMQATGARLQESADTILQKTIEAAGVEVEDLAYCITTGYGRHQFEKRNLQVTDLTATARGRVLPVPGHPDRTRYRRPDHEGQPHRRHPQGSDLPPQR